MYAVTLITTSQSGCNDTLQKVVDVYCIPTADFVTLPACREDSSRFLDQSKITSGTVSSYVWDFGDPASGTGNSSAVKNAKHVFSDCGTFDVTLMAVSNKGCTDTKTKPATVYCLPQPDFIHTDVCLKDSTSFKNLSTISNDTLAGYVWDLGDGSPNVIFAEPKHLYASSGTYVVKLIATSVKGCRDTSEKSVRVFDLPIGGILADTVCFGTETQFRDITQTVPGDFLVSWNWDFGDAFNSTEQNPKHTYAGEGVYPLQLIVKTNHGCLDTVTSLADVSPIPVVGFTDSIKGCSPVPAFFSDTSSISRGSIINQFWNFGNGSYAYGKDVGYLYQTSLTFPISYNVGLTVTSDRGCKASLSKPGFVTLYPLPLSDFLATPKSVSIFTPKISFNDRSQGNSRIVSWDWQFGDGSISNVTNPVHVYKDPGTYNVRLIIENNYGCLDTVYRSVDIKPEFTFYVPNSFTPNEDGANETFYGSGIGIADYRMDIFDRWGNFIFSTVELKTGWDGRANGGKDIAQQDVYVYVVNLTDVFGEKHKYIGHFSLIR
jgi:gliding motility-associated-like protein